MSFVALATDQFDAMVEFYGEQLGFPVVDGWDRERGRGRRFDLGGLRLEVLDNQREPQPQDLGDATNKVHVVVEVEDIHAARDQLNLEVPAVADTSWGARLFQLEDPDGVAVTYLQWTQQEASI